MNVGEETANPWLDEEYELLRGWVAEEKPPLGVCLGGQTLAHATGGRVTRAPRWHAGFYHVELSDEGGGGPGLGGLPPPLEGLPVKPLPVQPPPRAPRPAPAAAGAQP